MDKIPVAVLGLGAMGAGMAKHLLKEKFEVTGFDVVQPSVERFIQAGGKGATSPAEAVKAADVAILMVSNAAQVHSVLFDDQTGAIRTLKQGAVVIISSTVPPSFCAELQDRLNREFQREDVFLLDCPVSGGTTGAASGRLSVFSSGPAAGLEKAKPVLEALSAVLYNIPGGVGAGSKAKMCHQVLPEVVIALANEAMALAARAGLNTQEVFDAIQAGSAWSWINGNRIPYMLKGDKTIYSAIPNSQKDSAIIVNQARMVSFPVPLVAAAEQAYWGGIHAGWAKDDDSTLWRLYLRNHPEDTIYQMTKSENPNIRRDETVTVQQVVDIFVGGHLAAAAEAMGLAEAVGIDTNVMYDIISKAAGANTQFIDQVPKMKKPTWSLRDVPEAKDIGTRLVRSPSSRVFL